MEPINACLQTWDRRLPQGFKFLLDRLARGFVLVRPSNGPAFAMLLMMDMLESRNDQRKNLPEMSYLAKLKQKVDRRACMCTEPLLLSRTPTAYESSYGATSRAQDMLPASQECARTSGIATSCRNTQTSEQLGGPLCFACGKSLPEGFTPLASHPPSPSSVGQISEIHHPTQGQGSTQASSPKREVAIQVSKGHYEYIPWDDKPVKNKKCHTCEKRMVSGPTSAAKRSASSAPKHSEIVSSLPGQGSGQAFGPGKEVATQVSNDNYPLFPSEQDMTFTGQTCPSCRNSTKVHPEPPAKPPRSPCSVCMPTSVPYEILSPMPGEGSRPSSHPGSEADAQIRSVNAQGQAVSGRVCTTCRTNLSRGSTPPSQHTRSTSSIRQQSPEPVQIVSPLPGGGFTPFAGSSVDNKLLQSSEPYVILSPMPASPGGGPLPKNAPTKVQPQAMCLHGQRLCGTCLASRVEGAAMKELLTESRSRCKCLSTQVEYKVQSDCLACQMEYRRRSSCLACQLERGTAQCKCGTYQPSTTAHKGCLVYQIEQSYQNAPFQSSPSPHHAFFTDPPATQAARPISQPLATGTLVKEKQGTPSSSPCTAITSSDYSFFIASAVEERAWDELRKEEDAGFIAVKERERGRTWTAAPPESRPSPVRLPSPEPYEIISPLPMQGNYPIITGPGRGAARQSSRGSYQFNPLNSAPAEGQLCCTCVNGVADGSVVPLQLLESSARQPSPVPIQRNSPVPGQGSMDSSVAPTGRSDSTKSIISTRLPSPQSYVILTPLPSY